MDSLTLLFIISGGAGLIFLLWTYTPRGKKWLKDL